MQLYRAMLSVFVAVAIVFAPIATAWAGGANGKAAVMALTTSHAVDNAHLAAAASMEDCASMMKGASGMDDCPHCDKDKVCTPLCMAKCFQFLGLTQQSRPLARLMTALYLPATPAIPPNWSDQPQPPPPRT